MLLFLSPDDVLQRGLDHFVSGFFEASQRTNKNKKESFWKIFGCSSTCVAKIWFDILDQVPAQEKTERDFKMFLSSLYFLYQYPKNAKVLGACFGVSQRMVEGNNLWKWLKRISALKDKVIVWPEEEFNDPNGAILIATVDGIDFHTWEPKHPFFPLDKGAMLHKYRKAALKYEIAVHLNKSQIVWINGPFPGAVHDKVIYCSGLKDKIPPGKKILSDSVYSSAAHPDDHAKLALKDPLDDKQTAKYKARGTSRHETLNGRLRFFKSLSNTYRHKKENHRFILYSVAVIVQTEMNMGHELFAI